MKMIKLYIILILFVSTLTLQSQDTMISESAFVEIGSEAFEGATINKGIAFPPSLMIIGESAFKNSQIPNLDFTRCINLEQIRSNAFFNAELNCLNILDFSNSSKLRCYINGTQDGASFAGFTGKVILPREIIIKTQQNSLENIGESAFENSTIGSIDFGACVNLKQINTNAFKNIRLVNNTSINLSTGIKLAKIEGTAFEGSNLTRLLLPDSLKYIGDKAFAECSNLKSITCYNPTPPELGTTVFKEVNTDECKLFVMEKALTNYASTDQWKDFYKQLVIGSEPEDEDGGSESNPGGGTITPPTPCADCDKILFTYDASGNRIKKEIILAKTRSTESDVPDEIEPFMEDISKHKVIIYPNPTKGQITISISDLFDISSGNLRIINMQGKVISQYKINSDIINLDISGEPVGIYIMYIEINGQQSTWKIIKE